MHGDDLVLHREPLRLPGEVAGGDEHRHVRGVFGLRGAEELLHIAARHGAMGRVVLALDHQSAPVRHPADDVGAQVTRLPGDDDLGAAVPAAQLGDVPFEPLPGHGVDLGHGPLTCRVFLLGLPGAVFRHGAQMCTPQPPADAAEQPHEDHRDDVRPHRLPDQGQREECHRAAAPGRAVQLCPRPP
ncbi:hypothetical protein GCM10017744_068990 [Streptomyces antimycoticus]